MTHTKSETKKTGTLYEELGEIPFSKTVYIGNYLAFHIYKIVFN